MTYEEMAMDAGYTGEEAQQYAQMLEHNEQEHMCRMQEEEWESLQREAVEDK